MMNYWNKLSHYTKFNNIFLTISILVGNLQIPLLNTIQYYDFLFPQFVDDLYVYNMTLNNASVCFRTQQAIPNSKLGPQIEKVFYHIENYCINSKVTFISI